MVIETEENGDRKNFFLVIIVHVFGDKEISNHSFAVYLNSNSKRQLRLTPYYICGADAKTSTVAVGQE